MNKHNNNISKKKLLLLFSKTIVYCTIEMPACIFLCHAGIVNYLLINKTKKNCIYIPNQFYACEKPIGKAKKEKKEKRKITSKWNTKTKYSKTTQNTEKKSDKQQKGCIIILWISEEGYTHVIKYIRYIFHSHYIHYKRWSMVAFIIFTINFFIVLFRVIIVDGRLIVMYMHTDVYRHTDTPGNVAVGNVNRWNVGIKR